MKNTKLYWGYPFFWIMMGKIATDMVYFFCRKGWFSNIATPHRKS